MANLNLVGTIFYMDSIGNESGGFDSFEKGEEREQTELCYHSWENLVNSDERTIICVNCGEDWDINQSDSAIIGVLWQASREAIENLSENIADLRALITSKLSLEPCCVCNEYIDRDDTENLVLKYGVCCLECLPLVIAEATESGIETVTNWAVRNGMPASEELKKQVLWLKLQYLNRALNTGNVALMERELTLPDQEYHFLSTSKSVKLGELAKKLAEIYGTEIPKTEISAVFLAELLVLTLEIYNYAESPAMTERLAQSVKDSLSYPDAIIDLIIADLLDGSGASKNVLGLDLFNMVIETGTERLLDLLKNKE
jgi:hypothetical protein